MNYLNIVCSYLVEKMSNKKLPQWSSLGGYILTKFSTKKALTSSLLISKWSDFIPFLLHRRSDRPILLLGQVQGPGGTASFARIVWTVLHSTRSTKYLHEQICIIIIKQLLHLVLYSLLSLEALEVAVLTADSSGPFSYTLFNTGTRKAAVLPDPVKQTM